MDSDSGDVSSGNESDNNGPQSPNSSRSQSRGSNVRSVGSRSRSSSPSQSVKRDSPQNSPKNQQTSVRSPPQSPQSPVGSRRSSDAQSELSGSSSSDENSPYYSSKNRHTSKSPGSNSYQNNGKHSPVSIKSVSSHVSKKSRSSRDSRGSRRSSSSRGSRRSSEKSDNENSDSSKSVDSSSRKNKNISKVTDLQPEEISNDKGSIKSVGSSVYKKSRSGRDSRGSRRSGSSRGSRRSSEKSDNENSDSSKSVDSSSRKNKNIFKVTDPQPEEISDDKGSIKSISSSIYKKSRSGRDSMGSRRSNSSRGSRRSSEKSDNENSDSSKSVDSSSRKNKNISKIIDTQPEEISDGDMESDNEKNENNIQKEDVSRPEINISHEDLSDVSDLEESIGNNSDDNHSEDHKEENKNDTKVIENEIKSPEAKLVTERSCRPEEGEEQLDFEAEDGECGEITQGKEVDIIESDKTVSKENEKVDEKPKERDELEEGEVTDEDDVRPEETEPRPVCRFFSRGQCTWGASCRFLHPGVTDKGNYTMFELIRPVVPGEFSRDERLFGKIEPPLVESAWERGLRTAKEMLRKSVKRKEQDIDFEEKKMNLSLAQEEFDKENGYYGRVPSPEPRYVRHVPVEYPVARPPSEEYYGRRQVLYEPEYVPPPRERIRSYRELPTHRMPDYYNNKYEEEPQSSTKRTRPKREVIVQRAEERQGRGDEWSDPWMRSKSPGRRKESGRKRSYSSGSSYSSSSSSRTTSETSRSSYRSRSRSSHRRRRSRSHRGKQLSPSVIVSERKAANERAALMNPPAPKRRAPSPGMMRVSGAANPPAPSREDPFSRNRSKLAVAAALARVKGRRRMSSDSSVSSSSDSDSSDSSSSSSRDGTPPRRTGLDLSIAKAMDALKGTSSEKKQIKLNLKNPVGVRKPEPAEIARKPETVQVKKRPASSPPPGDKSKKATSRREELLKQLKAVEDAIAKKRSKVN